MKFRRVLFRSGRAALSLSSRHRPRRFRGPRVAPVAGPHVRRQRQPIGLAPRRTRQPHRRRHRRDRSSFEGAQIMIAWAFDAIIGSTLLMLLVLAVRTPVARLFGATWAYALWLLPALRLVMPHMPSLLTPVSVPSYTVVLDRQRLVLGKRVAVRVDVG